jgi:hypothetical protein
MLIMGSEWHAINEAKSQKLNEEVKSILRVLSLAT